MAVQHDIQSLSQVSTAEEYTRPFILLSFQHLISNSSGIFSIGHGRDHHPFCDSIRRCRD